MRGTAARRASDRDDRRDDRIASESLPSATFRLVPLISRIRQRRLSIRPAASPFVADSVDSNETLWTLFVARDGRIALKCNDIVVAELSAHAGMEVLQMNDVPFERAEDVLLCITCEIPMTMSENARASLETDLAPWIAENM